VFAVLLQQGCEYGSLTLEELKRSETRSTIKRQIDAHPVIIHGNFTGVRQIMVVVGHDIETGTRATRMKCER